LRAAAKTAAVGTRWLRRVHKTYIMSTVCSLCRSCALGGMGRQGGERRRGGGELIESRWRESVGGLPDCGGTVWLLTILLVCCHFVRSSATSFVRFPFPTCSLALSSIPLLQHYLVSPLPLSSARIPARVASGWAQVRTTNISPFISLISSTLPPPPSSPPPQPWLMCLNTMRVQGM
jgi:hypothetical protein